MVDVDIQMHRKHFMLNVKASFSPGITGIYGPSGSGKTTLMQSIAGIVEPTQGHITLFGHMVLSSERKVCLTPNERRIGYVFQDGRLFPHMTVAKNLLYAYNRDKGHLSFREVVELLKIKHLLKQKPAQLSGGEKQRVALGRTLLSSPKLLLLDEPFSALDPHLRNDIIPFLQRIHIATNIPILVVSHDLTDLLKLTHKLFVIKDGRCLGHGNYTDLLKNPQIREMLGARVFINALDMEVTSRDQDSGVVMLKMNTKHQEVRAVVSKKRQDCLPGNKVKMFLPADDISLSKNMVENISVLNQHKGVVKQVINGNNVNVCIVDVGFELVVEISSESVLRLDLKPDAEVWCLFKSVSLDIVV